MRRFFPAAPSWLLMALVAGGVLTILGVPGALFARAELQLDPYDDKKSYLPQGRYDIGSSCRGALESRAKRLHELDEDIQRSNQRARKLEGLLLRTSSPHFLGARTELGRELEFTRELNSRRESLLIDRDVKTSGFMLIGAVLATWVTMLVLRSYERLRRHLAYSAPESRLGASWWLASVSLVSVPALAGQFMLPFAEDKTWFGWDSFCISPAAFLWVKVALLGTQMMASCPVAVLADASRPELLGAARGPAAREYVRFTTTWTFWGLVLVLTCGGIWLCLAFNTSRTPTERVSYGLPVIGMMLVSSAVLYRFVGNMRAMRSGHEQSDPTSAFFEDVPWRLPPALLALGTAGWIVLERLGIIDSLLGK